MAHDEPLAVLRDDPHLIAVVKPAGMLTQGYSGGEPTLEDAVRRLIRPDDPGSIYLGTVHRLDRPVTGAVVWAKTPRSSTRLAAQFAGRTVAKTYWAAVEGDAVVAGERWDDWLGPVDPSGVVRVVAQGTPGGRRAVTRVRPLRGRVPEGVVLLELRPVTGRTHQLRAQATARGRPVVGDARYGASRPFPDGIALHARGLEFVHPASREVVRLEAPLPRSWGEAGLETVPGNVSRPL